MEIVVPKISELHDNSIFYNGVIAYGRASDGNTYVLRAQPEAQLFYDCQEYCGDEIQIISKTNGINDNNLDFFDISTGNWFVICRVEETDICEIFENDDEMGEGLIFETYDDAIEGFKTFLL